MKRVANIFYTLFFIASLIFEGYCLQRLETNYVTIIGSGVVVLIASYLFLDVVISVYIKERNCFLEAAEKRQQYAINELKEEMLEMQKVQKALYVSNKRQTEAIKELEKTVGSVNSSLNKLSGNAAYEETA